jgi:hypothetical protein
MRNYIVKPVVDTPFIKAVLVADRDTGRVAYTLHCTDQGGWHAINAYQKALSLARELTNAVDEEAERAVLTEFDELFRD